MARETRGQSKPAAEVTPPSSVKRKRRGSPTPPPPIPKVTLPSPQSLPKSHEANGSLTARGNVSTSATEEHEAKRPKIGLKLKRPPVEGAKATDPEATTAAAQIKDVKEEPKSARGLDKAVREALTIVIKEMAVGLPPPINNILTLWLPPNFEQKPENTLGHVMQQDSLTWEHLVDTLHIFAKNLLVPCNYPNPMPPSTQFHLPVPVLPSHYPHHPIYAFCAGLYTLMTQIEPTDAGQGLAAERWGLVQKVPNHPSASGDNGDWFTAGIDSREVDTLLAKLRKGQEQHSGDGESLMEKLASTGDRLGYANAIALQSASVSAKPKVRTLDESIVQRASLKAQIWKEARGKRLGGFGNSDRSVRIPPMSSMSFTPSFGATYDSNHYFAGYYDTIAAMHERARLRAWRSHAARHVQPEKGYRGTLEVEPTGKDKGKSKETVEDILEENNALIEELQAWQDLRVQKRDVNWLPEREEVVASELLASLTKLASMTGPSELLGGQDNAAGMAHRLAQRLLQTSGPSIRGVLDPRRPHALHDNLTVRPKAASSQPLGGAPSPVAATPSPAYPARQSTMSQPARQQPSYPSPGTPYRPPTPNYTYTSPFQQPNGAPSAHAPHQPAASTPYRPPLAGPSGLRQSFGPQTPQTAQR